MIRTRLTATLVALCFGLGSLGFVTGFTPATAQDYPEDYEYEPDEGVHEEEWYDPSDWGDEGGDFFEDMDEDESWFDVGDERYVDDDYGYYDESYYWDTDDEWFGDWYGESDEW